MGRYPLSTIINGKKYAVHVVRKQRKDFRCILCGEEFQAQQGYVFMSESERPAHVECARISSKSLKEFM
jgi:transposase-like protein